MGLFCPVDAKPCVDDLCHGGGCIRALGAPMLSECTECGGLVDDGMGFVCEECEWDMGCCDDDD